MTMEQKSSFCQRPAGLRLQRPPGTRAPDPRPDHRRRQGAVPVRRLRRHHRRRHRRRGPTSRSRRSTRASAASPGWSGPSSTRAWPGKAPSPPSSDPTTSATPNPTPAGSWPPGAASPPSSPPGSSPIFLLARDAAAGDPEVAATLEQISAARLERMTVNARGLASAGHLRPGITPEQAADIMWTYSSPELYELLVIRRGWPAGALRPVHRTGPDRRPAPRPRYLKPFRRPPPGTPASTAQALRAGRMSQAEPGQASSPNHAARLPRYARQRRDKARACAPSRRIRSGCGSDSVTFRDRCGRLRAVRFV